MPGGDICPSCSRPTRGCGEACPYCGEPLGNGEGFRLRLWMPLAAFLAIGVSLSAMASFPMEFNELIQAMLESSGIVADPCSESGLRDVLRSLAVLVLVLPVRRKRCGAPAPIHMGEVASGVAWRLFLFADMALCFAVMRGMPEWI